MTSLFDSAADAVTKAFADIPALLEQTPALIARGRLLDCECLLGPTSHPFHASIRAGHIVALVPAPVLMRSWRFSYRAQPAAWVEYWQAAPRPGWHDLLALTKRLTVFGTVHAPLFNPVIAAKEMVTADHIGEGRFGLNIVVGWNEGEFQMFGVQQRDHESRYEYAQEWIDVIKMIWSDKEDFDFEGQYLKMKGIKGKPKPYGGVRPVIMNAGASPVGQAFAIRNCDAFFLQASRTSLDETAQKVANAKAQATEQGRELGVYTVGVITCRPTKKEAEDYYHYSIVEHADWRAVDDILALKNITAQNTPPKEFQQARTGYAQGMGGLPIVGDPDHVAGQLIDLSKAGLTGVALSFVNYVDELPFFCDEVMPRLEEHRRRGR